jgi:hypothetical protein
MVSMLTELHQLPKANFASSLSIKGQILIFFSELGLYVQHFVEGALSSESAMAHYIIIIHLVNFAFIM